MICCICESDITKDNQYIEFKVCCKDCLHKLIECKNRKIERLQARSDFYKEAYNDHQKQVEKNFEKEVNLKVACVLESVDNSNLIIEMAKRIKELETENGKFQKQLKRKKEKPEGVCDRFIEKERGE